MSVNISKYIQLNNFLLLEYEFNRDAVTTPLTKPYVVDNYLGTKFFYEGDGALGKTNNILPLSSVPINDGRTSWFFDPNNYNTTYPRYWDPSYYDTSIAISSSDYPCDTVKVHMVSGYNFDDVTGFLLQVRAQDTSLNLVDLTNFTYAKQTLVNTGNIIKFASNTLFLGNRFYDKYVEFKVPSIQTLQGDTTPSPAIAGALSINNGSDVYITFSTIFEIINSQYVLDEKVNVQLPVTSIADSFNCFIAESTNGDFIEYYATWGLGDNKSIIGDYIDDIESGRIKLYTSNNPNDNYSDFTDSYGTGARKWVLMHEISVFENIPGGTSLLTQKYSFTQDSNYSLPNYFRPILRNADIDSSYIVTYVCRLMNRMDGTQIIRKASFSSADPKKYGMWFTRLNVDNLIPYKVFNRIEAEATNISGGSGVEKTKYVKVFFDTITIVMNAFNELFPQGTGPLFLKSYDSVYKFKFEKIDTNGDRVNVDLSGAYDYALQFKLDDNSKIEVGPTYSTNMNTTIGEIEFKLSEDQLSTIKKQTNKNFLIVVKNPNGTSYVFYQGVFYDLADQATVMANYSSLFTVTDLQTNVANLEAQVATLTVENAALKTK